MDASAPSSIPPGRLDEAREDDRSIRPKLLIFEDRRSGHSRRVEPLLAQVLQSRGNHDAFEIIHVDMRERPDLVERLRIDIDPTFLVVENRRIERRLKRPPSVSAIEQALARWLR